MRYSICMIPKIKENLSSYNPSGPIAGLPQAAVLILLHETGEDLNVIYCLRSNNLPTHAGEVAFPGGKREEKDETLRDTALREAQEEVNLELKDVEVLGEISSVQSRFGLSVTPYIGILKINSLIADGKEIAEVFSVPLKFIKNNMQKEQKSENWENKKVFFPFFEFENKMVWGLTAYMTVEFLKLLDIEIDLTRK